jgi:copper(I)-binding protein
MIIRPCVRYPSARREHGNPNSHSTFTAISQVDQPPSMLAKATDTLLSVSALRAALIALGAAVLTAACAAGQQAQTSVEKPSIDGTEGSIGQISLVNVSFHAPSGTSYAAGADAGMSVYISNGADSADKLTNVSSSAFPGGWSVVKSSSLSSATPSATPLPASTSSPATTTGTPLKIPAGSAVGLGLSGIGADGGDSPKTLVLKGLASGAAPLTPGMSVKVTFTFANAGQTTLTVPVHLSSEPYTQTLPGSASPAG